MAKKFQPGKPSIEEKIAEYQGDPEFQEAIAESEEDRKQADRIVQHFRLGAKAKCARKIWCQLEKEADESEAPALADLLKIRREEVYKLKKGRMTLEMLVALLSELGCEFTNLWPMPSLRERAISGYQAAVHWAKTGDSYPSEEQCIPEEALIAVCLLLRDSEYRDIRDKRELDDADWRGVAARVRSQVAIALQVDPAGLRLKEGGDFKTLQQSWARHVAECVHAVRHRWLRGIDG